MLMPSIIGESLFDDWMDFYFPGVGRMTSAGSAQGAMRTDVKETDDGYELDIDLPGYKKEDVKVQLKDGYLMIQAVRNQGQNQDQAQKKEEGRYIRRERFYGSVSRSFYVGDKLTEEDIRAKFEDGILKLSLPKQNAQKIEKNNYIQIEG